MARLSSMLMSLSWCHRCCCCCCFDDRSPSQFSSSVGSFSANMSYGRQVAKQNITIGAKLAGGRSFWLNLAANTGLPCGAHWTQLHPVLWAPFIMTTGAARAMCSSGQQERGVHWPATTAARYCSQVNKNTIQLDTLDSRLWCA